METGHTLPAAETSQALPPFCEQEDVDQLRSQRSGDLRTLLGGVDQTVDPEMAQRMTMVGQTLEVIKSLSRGDYDRLDGLLTHARQTEEGNGEANLRRVLSNLQGAPENGKLPEGTLDVLKRLALLASNNSALALLDAILALRFGYPEGKNVINRTWDETQGPLSFSAAEPCSISCAGTMIDVRPTEESVSLVEAEGKSCVLHEGDTICVGRPLLLSAVLGASLYPEAFYVRPHITIDGNEAFSRMSLLIRREGGRIFIFDKASRCPVTARQGAGWTVYDPETLNKDGTSGSSRMHFEEGS